MCCFLLQLKVCLRRWLLLPAVSFTGSLLSLCMHADTIRLLRTVLFAVRLGSTDETSCSSILCFLLAVSLPLLKTFFFPPLPSQSRLLTRRKSNPPPQSTICCYYCCYYYEILLPTPLRRNLGTFQIGKRQTPQLRFWD